MANVNSFLLHSQMLLCSCTVALHCAFLWPRFFGLLSLRCGCGRSPSKSQRKHQQRLAARHLREKQDAARSKEGATIAAAVGTQGADALAGTGGGALSLPLQQPLATVQETAAFPPLPSSKPAQPPSPGPALPTLRLIPTPQKADPVARQSGAALPASEVQLGKQGGQPGLGVWSAACEAALRERKVQVHAAQLQG